MVKNEKEQTILLGILLIRKKTVNIQSTYILHIISFSRVQPSLRFPFMRQLIIQKREQKYYGYTDSAGLSLATEEGSASRSPMLTGGPMLHRAVLCISMASFIF